MKITTVILSATILLAACSGKTPKEEKLPAGKGNTETSEESNSFHFKVNGEPVKSTGWNITLFKLKKRGTLQLNISSNMHKDSRTINANIGSITPGTYIFKEGDANTYGNYYPDYKKNMLNSYSFVSGSVNITTLDTVKHIINAVFSGQVKNGKGETINITDGKIINGKLSEKVEEY